jgi:hypothetical protein
MEITLDIFRNSQIMQRNLIFRYENKSKSQQIIENIKKLIFKNIYSKESFEFRNMYYKTLEYFKNKYSTDIFSEKILEMYKIKLLKNNEDEKEIDMNKSFRNKSFMKFKYFLLCDCLYINSFYEKEKAYEIIKEFEELYKFPQKFMDLYNILYENGEIIEEFNGLKDYIKLWKENNNFNNQKEKKVLITATMSAGKSTLINALIGKKISKVTNEACTEKLHYIYNKPYEDGNIYEFDNELSLNATEETLLENDKNNTQDKILVSSYFRGFDKSKVCFIDTPGINSSLRSNDKFITEKKLKEKDYDVLLYVFNAENISSTDNFNYLNYIFRNKKDNKIIFVINKLDSFRKGEDSIEDTIMNVDKELKKIGFKDPIVCPISAHAGFLAKQKIFNEIHDEDILEDVDELARKFKKEYWNLSKYYNCKISDEKIENNKYEILLKNSGIKLLERKILEI